uniref:Uncharacterized protein LOC111127056 n=1 Tax=Crassostrea virginica TaxID=6565 RepID=A0A8B8DI05_CRAVI|nr:uncharacterized protein LOC111127056 [Crassostrea virginica]
MVDYSTRFPEAVALKGIETERVAEALFEFFTRLGISKEILSDMGTQFTSYLMKEVGRLLSIAQLTTTPYHPACSGLVEKFNGTLKQMLRRMAAERPKTGTVRGPMTVLREMWTKELRDPEVKSTYQYVIDLKERLEETCELAKQSLQKSIDVHGKIKTFHANLLKWYVERKSETPEVLSTCVVIEEEPFENADDESDFL